MSVPSSKFYPKEIEKFIRDYVTKLENLVTGIYSDVKLQGYESGIPLQFPVSVQVFQVERGLFFYFDKSDFFNFKIINQRKKKSRWRHFILATHFEKWKDRGHDKAKFDVRRLYYVPDSIESFAMQNEERWEEAEAQHIEDITAEVDYYIDYLKDSEKIITETKRNHIYELYDILEIIVKYASRMKVYLSSGSWTCFETWSTVMTEMESAFFLALYGKYFSAIALLRKVFEIPCRAIFLDFNLKNDNSYEEIKEQWYAGEKFHFVYSNMINRLIVDEEDKLIKPFLNILYDIDIDIRIKLKNLYKELSKYVHFIPEESIDEMPILFSEYNEEEMKKFYKLFIESITMTDILFILKNPSSIEVINKYDYPNIGSEKMERLIKIIKSHHTSS